MNINDIVSLRKCEDYNYQNVYDAVKKSVEDIGGMDIFVKIGQNVVIKPNLIMMKSPDKCATTHPEVLRAVIMLVREYGGNPIIVESPGGIYKRSYLETVYKICGIKSVCEETGAELCYDLDYENVNFSVNGNNRSSMIITKIREADVLINLCKLKTHMMSNYTGGVKNLYGAVPGVFKANYHLKYSSREEFFSFVTDLTCYLNPTLTIADAVNVMEGEGPTNGSSRHLGLIMASANPFNLDYLGHTIFNFTKDEIITSKLGTEYGYQPEKIGDIKTAGERYTDYIMYDIKKPDIQSSTFDEKIPPVLRKPLRKYLTPYPKFKKDKCRKCKCCVNACPAKVLKLGEEAPEFIDKSKCIRCYCCHELCPYGAVALRKLPKILR